jgi:hypothetical protein
MPSSATPAPAPPLTPSVSSSPSPPATASPSASSATEFRDWARSDLPDPAPEVYGGGLPTAVVAFHGTYMAAGTVWTSCCDGSRAWLNRGVAWTSNDGRAWTLHDPISAFDHASLTDLVTDGIRLIAVGTYADPTQKTHAVPVAAAWVSSDGTRWARASGSVPSAVAVGARGFIGAAVTADPSPSKTSVRFVWSTDGMHWTSVSDSFDADLRGLAAAPDGAAIAVGAVPGAPRTDGTTTTDMVVWRSPDGTTWTEPETVGHDALPIAVTSDGQGFLAVVRVSALLANGSIGDTSDVWRLAGGSEPRPMAIPMGAEESLDSIFVIGDALIATGVTLVDGANNVMVWISTDGGASWVRLADQTAFSDLNNEVAGIVQTPAGLVAVGSHWDSPSVHPLPSVWLAAR